jgi:peptidoglycan-associated lipoprotein
MDGHRMTSGNRVAPALAGPRAGRTSQAVWGPLPLLALLVLAGCATKGYVNRQVTAVDAATDAKIAGVKTQVDDARQRADQAFDKATLAEQIASGTVQATEVGATDVRFAFDDWRLDDDAQAQLDSLAAQLSNHPRYAVEIRGYCDAVGTDRYNYRLGNERAQSVERYLLTRYDVPAGRIAVVSFGEEDPVESNGTREGRAENRRAHVRLLELTPKPEGTPVAQSDRADHPAEAPQVAATP